MLKLKKKPLYIAGSFAMERRVGGGLWLADQYNKGYGLIETITVAASMPVEVTYILRWRGGWLRRWHWTR